MQNVTFMSASSEREIRGIVGMAIPRYTPEDLAGADDLPAVVVGNATVMPRRIGRKKVVFLCYRGGKLLGSAMEFV